MKPYAPKYDFNFFQNTGVFLLQLASYVTSPHPEPEPVFLNVYGAQELTPRNEFRQPM